MGIVKEPFTEFIEEMYPAQHQMIKGDTLSELKKMDSEKFDLVITSPPYNVGKEYETKTSIEKYLEQQESVIDELIRVTSNRGNLCWQVRDYVDKGE
ncbi:MAG: DNA methyltransferase [Ekhidna sp.]|nr:DNA methyltransferase [Ekhidna sp.]